MSLITTPFFNLRSQPIVAIAKPALRPTPRKPEPARPFIPSWVSQADMYLSPIEKKLVSLVRSAHWEMEYLKTGRKEQMLLASGLASLTSALFGAGFDSFWLGVFYFPFCFSLFFELFMPIHTTALKTLKKIFPDQTAKGLRQNLVETNMEDPTEILERFPMPQANQQKLAPLLHSNLS